MSRIVAYDIVTAHFSTELVKAVTLYIKEGWQPFGQVVRGDGHTMYQPVVKYASPINTGPR